MYNVHEDGEPEVGWDSGGGGSSGKEESCSGLQEREGLTDRS